MISVAPACSCTAEDLSFSAIQRLCVRRSVSRSAACGAHRWRRVARSTRDRRVAGPSCDSCRKENRPMAKGVTLDRQRCQFLMFPARVERGNRCRESPMSQVQAPSFHCNRSCTHASGLSENQLLSCHSSLIALTYRNTNQHPCSHSNSCPSILQWWSTDMPPTRTASGKAQCFQTIARPRPRRATDSGVLLS